MTMTMDKTAAIIGRSMKNRDMDVDSLVKKRAINDQQSAVAHGSWDPCDIGPIRIEIPTSRSLKLCQTNSSASGGAASAPPSGRRSPLVGRVSLPRQSPIHRL